METLLRRVGWESARIARRAGWPGCGAAVLMALCGAAWLSMQLPASREAQALRADNQALTQRLAQAGAAPRQPDIGPEQQWSRFESRFATEKDIAPSLARMLALARRHGLSLDQAEFRFVTQAGDPLARYSIVLPVKAEYRALRRFVRDLLQDSPGIALEEISVRRNDAKSVLTEARLRLVLFVARSG